MSPSQAGSRATRPPRAGRDRARLIAAAALGVIVTLFAVLNLDEVEVNWILGSWSTPLIIVIVVSLVVGVAIDRLLLRHGRRSGA